MIDLITFSNFKVLRDAQLPLSPCTLILGPNGSGKSTVFEGLELISRRNRGIGEPMGNYAAYASAGVSLDRVQIEVSSKFFQPPARVSLRISPTQQPLIEQHIAAGMPPGTPGPQMGNFLKGIRFFSLDADAIANSVQLQPDVEIAGNGANLAVVLTQLQDMHPERFEALNIDLGRWIPEFDRILFSTPGRGQRGFSLRTRTGRHAIAAHNLSHGTRLALCMLALAHLPTPPSVVCLEEPDRGIHPRLLREVRDALYRLAYPQDFGESRPPVQVIATTHSPYMLDLFRDHPEEIVLSQKNDLSGTFERLTDIPDYEEIIKDAALSDLWYSGILGGVPAAP